MLKNHFAEDYRGHVRGKNRDILLIKATCKPANTVIQKLYLSSIMVTSSTPNIRS